MRQKQTTTIPSRASAAYPGRQTHQFTHEPQEDARTDEKQSRPSHWLTPVGCGAVIVLGVVVVWTYFYSTLVLSSPYACLYQETE